MSSSRTAKRTSCWREWHEFGINNLHFDKQELLEQLLPTCEKELFVSGYRLILLDKIAPLLTEVAQRGVEIRAIISPPWFDSFRLVYGEKEKVIDHYCRVFRALGCGPTAAPAVKFALSTSLCSAIPIRWTST